MQAIPPYVAWLRFCVSIALPLAAGAQVAPPASARPALLAPPALLRDFGTVAATLQIVDVAAFPVGADAISFELVLGDRVVQVDVHAADVRAPGYQLWRSDAEGVAVPIGPCTTFRGGLRGVAGSRAAVSWDGDGLRALLVAGDELWSVQPLRDAVPGAGASVHVVTRGADAVANAGGCGAVGMRSAPAGALSPDSVYECELALEADHALFLGNGSNVSSTQNEVLGIVNAVDVLFHGGLDVNFVVTQLIVDTVPDPYTTSVAGALLGQLQSYWNANRAAVQRDVVHLFSGRPIGASSAGTVGIANLAVVCDLANAYGLSETRWSTNYGLRVALTAHELGHNFGAGHCDPSPGCNVMCSAIGGCGGVTSSLGVSAVAEMQSYLQTVGCLELVPTVPQITSAAPALLETVAPPVVTLTGSGFLGTTAVTVGGIPMVQGIDVLGDGLLRFTPPAGLRLGLQVVTVTNAAGTSNATLVFYRGADPCRIVARTSIPGGTPMQWTLGGWPSDVGYLLLALDDTTVPLQGFPVLQSSIVLWAGALDARGMVTLGVPAVPALLPTFAFYSQMLDQDPGQGSLRSVSGVLRTLVF